MKKIKITDITLKKLSQDRQVSLLFREKTAIAACADKLGVDAVELAPIKNVREDNIIYKTIFTPSVITPTIGPNTNAPINIGTSLKSIFSHGKAGSTGKSKNININAMAPNNAIFIPLFKFSFELFII